MRGMGSGNGSVEGEDNSTAIRRRRPEAAAATAAGRLYADDTRSRPGEAAVSAAGTAAARGGAAAVAAAEAAVGLLPRSSLSSHLRWSLLLSFLQMTAKVCGGVPSPLIEPIVGRERKGPT